MWDEVGCGSSVYRASRFTGEQCVNQVKRTVSWSKVKRSLQKQAARGAEKQKMKMSVREL